MPAAQLCHLSYQTFLAAQHLARDPEPWRFFVTAGRLGDAWFTPVALDVFGLLEREAPRSLAAMPSLGSRQIHWNKF